MLVLAIVLGCLLAGALRVGYVVGYRTAERVTEDTLRREIELADSRQEWTGLLPPDAEVEQVLIDGRMITTTPVRPSFFRPHREQFCLGIPVKTAAEVRVVIRAPSTKGWQRDVVQLRMRPA